MPDMPLDNIEKKLLGLIQIEFPLTEFPYAEIGLKLGIREYEVIQHIQNLKVRGIIRQIGPVLDARKLGYQSTLVALKVAEKGLNLAEQVINAHPGISHGYVRDHRFNVWVTLSVPRMADINAELRELAGSLGAEVNISLPALKVFKLRTYFGAEGDDRSEKNNGTETLLTAVVLSPSDRLVINELQQDLPLINAPFRILASRLSMKEEDFLSQCRSLLDRGIVRRFGPSINHRNTGYIANAMSCWIAPAEKLEAAGKRLASISEVSHCYDRQTNSRWKYNLFAMIHGRAKEDCLRIVSKVSAEMALTERLVLFSIREFKKTRIKYQV